MKKTLMLAALVEAGTGVILLVSPSIVVRLLFAAEIGGAGIIMSRLVGIALIGLGAACWPGNGTRRAFYGMFIRAGIFAATPGIVSPPTLCPASTTSFRS
jgi:hypothetical protein